MQKNWGGCKLLSDKSALRLGWRNKNDIREETALVSSVS